MKVTLNGTTLAESNDTVVIENNHYFPPASINKDLFSDSKTSTVCPWKGTASYYNATVGGKTVTDVAWTRPNVCRGSGKVWGKMRTQLDF